MGQKNFSKEDMRSAAAHGALIRSIVFSRVILYVLDVGWCEASEGLPQICEELAPLVRRAGLAAGGASCAQGCDSCRTLQPHLLAQQLARMQQARHSRHSLKGGPAGVPQACPVRQPALPCAAVCRLVSAPHARMQQAAATGPEQ